MVLTTPDNVNMFIHSLFFNALRLSGGGAAPIVIFTLKSYHHAHDTMYNMGRFKIDTSVQNDITYAVDVPIKFGGKETVWIEATTDTANTEVSARWSGTIARIT